MRTFTLAMAVVSGALTVNSWSWVGNALLYAFLTAYWFEQYRKKCAPKTNPIT